MMPNRETLVRNLSMIPLLLLGGMFLVAFRAGDLGELDSFLEHGANARFPRSSHNVQMIVQEGTDGVVTDVKKIEDGRWAVEIELHGGPMAKQQQGERFWFLVKKSDQSPTGAYGALRFDGGSFPSVASKAVVLHDSPAIIQLVNPKTESVAESALQSGPPIAVEQKPGSRRPASEQPIPIFP